jgi:ribosome-binding factor A
MYQTMEKELIANVSPILSLKVANASIYLCHLVIHVVLSKHHALVFLSPNASMTKMVPGFIANALTDILMNLCTNNASHTHRRLVTNVIQEMPQHALQLRALDVSPWL